MRILLIADVHANWEALLSLQRAETPPDAVLFAGDAVGYGPDPVNCARWLAANPALAVRGNHDAALEQADVQHVPAELAEAARETVDYARRTLSAEVRAAVARWPLSASGSFGGVQFHLVHGTPLDPLGGRLDPATCSEAELTRLFAEVEADVIVLGHGHVPALRKFGAGSQTRLIVNPGSLGQPRYGVPDATYAVWEDGRIQIKHLHYDHDAVARRLRLLPLSSEAVDQLENVLMTGIV
jgi:putative phosphoesterase